MNAPSINTTAAALPSTAYERARAIGRAGGASGELTGQRLAAQGVSWDDVAYAAALARDDHETRVAAHEALDPAEREYQTDRKHWVALQAAAAAEAPGAWERTRAELGLRSEQTPSRLQLAALEMQRVRELEADYDRTMGRTPARHERPYTLADAEADEGAEAAWWAIEGMDDQRRELGDLSTAERVATFEQVHGTWNEEQGWQVPDAALSDGELAAATLTRDDLARVAATRRADAIARRLPELSVDEVLDLASHAQNTRHVTAPGELDDVAARADLRALQVEADQRAAGQPEHSAAALLSEYVDRARLDLDPAIDREKWMLAGALHRAVEDETRVARQDAARAQLPDPDDAAEWAGHDVTGATIPPPRSGEAPAPYENGRPSAGLDDLDPAPTHHGADRAERAAREADAWGHEERVMAEHVADEAALGGAPHAEPGSLRSLPVVESRELDVPEQEAPEHDDEELGT